MNKPLILRIFSSVGVIALAGAMALAQDAAPSNAPRSDGQIEMDVVHALDGSQALKNDLITAATEYWADFSEPPEWRKDLVERY